MSDEKADVRRMPAESVAGPPSRRIRRAARVVCFGLLCWCLVSALRGYRHYGSTTSVDPVKGDPERIWDQLPSLPASSLRWESCYDDYFECARMRVPLDYSKPSAGAASVALIKYPSKIPANYKEYKGPILFNPGGPGESGVSFIHHNGPVFQELLGQEYDIVSWDPRGVGRTTPQVNFFPDSTEGVAFRMRLQDDPLVNTTADALARIHARWSTLSSIAEARTRHSSPYVTTALVARDMLNIVHSFGREKLQYWGFSYGTFLGATFAAMFPDKIDRMVLDGVIDAEDYIVGRREKHLMDTDKVFREFADGCVEAGPVNCGLHQSTPQEVLDRLHNILDELKRSPVAVFASKTGPNNYGLIDYKLVKSTLLFFTAEPYPRNPFTGAAYLSAALAELEKGNGAPLWTALSSMQERFACSCPEHPQEPEALTGHAIQAIVCGDGGRIDDTVEELEEDFIRLSAISEFADVLWPRPACLGWSLPAAERFAGPFMGNTSYPILFIGNSRDPMTPLVNAHTVSKGFNGSVVLEQNSAGHCSLAASSACTAKRIRAYFREGELPEPDTICEAESRIFGPSPSRMAEDFSGEERIVVRAWRQLSEYFRAPMLGVLPPTTAARHV